MLQPLTIYFCGTSLSSLQLIMTFFAIGAPLAGQSLDVVSEGWVEGNNDSQVCWLCFLAMLLRLLPWMLLCTLRAHISSLPARPPAHLESRGTASKDSLFLGQDFPSVHVEFCNFGFFQPILDPFRWQPCPQKHQVVLQTWYHLTPNETALYCLLQIIDGSS